MVIRRVSPLSVAKIAGTLYAIIGLLMGAMFSLIAMAGGMASDSGGGAAFGAVFGIGAIVFFPILYGGLGFAMTLIMAALYNFLAGMVGGVEIEVQ
jgi:hypothetical protein